MEALFSVLCTLHTCALLSLFLSICTACKSAKLPADHTLTPGNARSWTREYIKFWTWSAGRKKPGGVAEVHLDVCPLLFAICLPSVFVQRPCVFVIWMLRKMCPPDLAWAWGHGQRRWASLGRADPKTTTIGLGLRKDNNTYVDCLGQIAGFLGVNL